MNAYEEKLTHIFEKPIFINSIKDLDNIDDIYDVVSEHDATISKEELQKYLEHISSQMQVGELSADELGDVAGGGGLTVLAVAAGVYGVTKAIESCYKVGTAVGKFIYNLGH